MPGLIHFVIFYCSLLIKLMKVGLVVHTWSSIKCCDQFQEENRILDKMHRQKVIEVEKLTQTVRELEETVLAGGAAANAVRDYQRKVQEMNVRASIIFE